MGLAGISYQHLWLLPIKLSGVILSLAPCIPDIATRIHLGLFFYPCSSIIILTQSLSHVSYVSHVSLSIFKLPLNHTRLPFSAPKTRPQICGTYFQTSINCLYNFITHLRHPTLHSYTTNILINFQLPDNQAKQA